MSFSQYPEHSTHTEPVVSDISSAPIDNAISTGLSQPVSEAPPSQTRQVNTIQSSIVYSKPNAGKLFTTKRMARLGNAKVAPMPSEYSVFFKTVQSEDSSNLRSDNNNTDNSNVSLPVEECNKHSDVHNDTYLFNGAGALGTIMSSSIETESLCSEKVSFDDSGLNSSSLSLNSHNNIKCNSESSIDIPLTSSGTTSSDYSLYQDDLNISSAEVVDISDDAGGGDDLAISECKHIVIQVRPYTAMDGRTESEDTNKAVRARIQSAKPILQTSAHNTRPQSKEKGARERPKCVPPNRYDSGISQVSSGSTLSSGTYTHDMDKTQNKFGPGLPTLEIPPVYRCTLSKKLMDCPVIATDGMTYDKKIILAWIRTHGTSPFTGEPMRDIRLKVDFVLLSKIQEWKIKATGQRHKIKLKVKNNHGENAISSIA